MLAAGRAILESFVGAGVPVDRIVATGGLPHAAPALIQTFADMLQQPIAIHPSTQGPAVGAAVLGGLASGEFAGIKEAVEAMAQSPSEGTVVEPDPAARGVGDELFARYNEMTVLALAERDVGQR